MRRWTAQEIAHIHIDPGAERMTCLNCGDEAQIPTGPASERWPTETVYLDDLVDGRSRARPGCWPAFEMIMVPDLIYDDGGRIIGHRDSGRRRPFPTAIPDARTEIDRDGDLVLVLCPSLQGRVDFADLHYTCAGPAWPVAQAHEILALIAQRRRISTSAEMQGRPT